MAQVGIVRRGTEYFREYAIERGDVLIRICRRYGHEKWRDVYNHPENAAFRARFPNFNQIDYVNPVNLLIPLAGSTITGKPARGKPPEGYMVIHVTDDSGAPLAFTPLRIIEPVTAHEGVDHYTDDNGDLLLSDPGAGMWHITSATWELMPASGLAADYPVQAINELPLEDGLPNPTYDLPVPHNAITELAARPVFYLYCPMCGVGFKTVKRAPGGIEDHICPNDNFVLSDLELAIEIDPDSFTSPPAGQNPTSAPNSLQCRGVETLDTAHGPVFLYWDESRFTQANQPGYTLWGQMADGTTKSVDIVGRDDWGANPPIFTPNANGKPRLYEFHETKLGQTSEYPYKFMAVPSNETTRLNDVLYWITVHHSVSLLSPQEVQHEHQQVGIGNDPDNKAADIGYHFVITSDGTVYEGRPLGIKGSHCELFNGGNLGIVLCGNFESEDPTPEALAALDLLVDVLAARFSINSIWSHRQRQRQANIAPKGRLFPDWTRCCGANLMPHVNALRKKYPGSGEPNPPI